MNKIDLIILDNYATEVKHNVTELTGRPRSSTSLHSSWYIQEEHCCNKANK